MQVRVGEPFTVMLWEDRTHGHLWQPRLDDLPIRVLDDDYERTIQIDLADSGKRTFELICSESGQFEIIFERRYGWKFTADGHRTVVVEATA